MTEYITSTGKVWNGKPGRRPRPIKDRFMENVEKVGGHWMWKGTVTIFGYPQIWYEGKPVRAHRLALELFVGPPPTPQHQADHLCHIKLCVNPAKKHLRWATPRENTLNYHPDGRFHVKGRAKRKEVF